MEHVNREKPVRRSVKKDRSHDRKDRRKKSGNKGSINPRNQRESRKNESNMKFSNVHQSRGRYGKFFNNITRKIIIRGGFRYIKEYTPNKDLIFKNGF